MIDDDVEIHQFVQSTLEVSEIPAKLISCYSLEAAIDYLGKFSGDLLLLDLCLKVRNDGARLSKAIQMGINAPEKAFILRFNSEHLKMS